MQTNRFCYYSCRLVMWVRWKKWSKERWRISSKVTQPEAKLDTAHPTLPSPSLRQCGFETYILTLHFLWRSWMQERLRSWHCSHKHGWLDPKMTLQCRTIQRPEQKASKPGPEAPDAVTSAVQDNLRWHQPSRLGESPTRKREEMQGHRKKMFRTVALDGR